MQAVFEGAKGSGALDFVTAWFIKAAIFIQGTSIHVAYVSTNSISQGEQVGLLWKELSEKYGMKISFAHQPFNWSNDARGKAAVHVVIIGFSQVNVPKKSIFTYESINSEPQEISAKNINSYLLNAPNLIISNRTRPICEVPRMIWGNKATDDGNFLFPNEKAKNEFVRDEPGSADLIRPYVSGRDFINNKYRYCLWLQNVSPKVLKRLPNVLKRVEAVKNFRLNSKAALTQGKAETPTIFVQISQPSVDYLAIPEVSSSRRKYIPIARLPSNVIASNTVQMVPTDDLYVFGVLSSIMHMYWMQSVCGRLKSDYRYSSSIVYNNFPWPKNASEKHRKNVKIKAKKVLDTRLKFTKSSFADLYDPLTTPPELVKAHNELDKAVDLCYRSQKFTSGSQRFEFLVNLLKEYLDELNNQVSTSNSNTG